ncbi:LYR domain-containing protein-containing protein 5 [Capsaspora owczarzaki ATCC 30864]|uniref:LYR domain-containing protein-containing protein 5 n=1 Tax=Capsaspora owczarzaki (strain ATCC 30864) TaxID=595528 RepID=A0A0D2X581_CAPO3|nr:LYR domain-containing protein-containing protein 5 [Capsaspora owczarzaki ATCC 30864]KJE97349.1 LYR domain-containing protein-containing protein 5 [Capsaspora owczarzaki ATCC 30864]|eukprot:XP_004343084.2 LYR domain-containing protein-containing protein 5 [Capsaspora owczarzaki ATCC 30864]
MQSMNSTSRRLYKELLFMGRDYPLGFAYFRERLHRAFAKNRSETDPGKIAELHERARFVIRELEAMYKLRKYRFLKRTYTDADTDPYSVEVMRALATAVENGSAGLAGFPQFQSPSQSQAQTQSTSTSTTSAGAAGAAGVAGSGVRAFSTLAQSAQSGFTSKINPRSSVQIIAQAVPGSSSIAVASSSLLSSSARPALRLPANSLRFMHSSQAFRP